jgi:pimeloyl-ACP methyl ester carboxylesterase
MLHLNPFYTTYRLGFIFPATFLISFFISILSAQDNAVPPGKFISIRGFNMYYETYGQGEPLLIIHGNGGSAKDFVHQVPFFKEHYQLILPESRSQGHSADSGDSLTYEMMADDLNAILDSLHKDSCYVIGWSDGGINGLLLAMRHPDKVKKLAVTGANLWPDSTAVQPFVYKWAMWFSDTLAKAPLTPENHNMRKLANLLLNEPHITTRQLSHIQCPTLVMGGDHDVILPQHTLLIAQSIPKSYCYIFPNSGHSTLIRYKDEFNKKVLDFFQQPFRIIQGQDYFN